MVRLENISAYAEEIALIVQHLNGRQQRIELSLEKASCWHGRLIMPYFFTEIIIEGVQLFLLRLNVGIRIILGLVFDERPRAVPDGDQCP